MSPIPITILTGYLGAGKTTLLNHLLTGDHGRRIAVVQNEFGAVAVDNDLVLAVDEAMVTLVNGCACCTARDDMTEAVEILLGNPARFEHIVIEASGLANPGPILFTLLQHPECGEAFVVDGVVAVADAFHLETQLARDSDAACQLAYADLVLLNKTDLVLPAELPAIETMIARINPAASIVRTMGARVECDTVLEVGAFDRARAEDLPAGFTAQSGHHARLPGVGSVALSVEGAVDTDCFERWIGRLLDENHGEVFRIKGILDARDQSRRYVVQAVHGLWSVGYERPWPPGPRVSRLVFIGRDLDGTALRAAFEQCRA